MIEDFIDSALIIDDKESEIKELKLLLNKLEIFAKHYLPSELKQNGPVLKNRKIIFLDLYVEPDKSLIPNISIIRSILKKRIGKDFGTYGIILWTKHPEDIISFKEKIANDAQSYTLPLFIACIAKTKYLESGNYDDLMQDINLELKKNVAASFFIYWSSLVAKGKDQSITNIYSLIPNYINQELDLKFVLLKLAQNYTGIPEAKLIDYNLEHDAIKAFSDMLHGEIINRFNSSINLFENIDKIKFSGNPDEEKVIFAALNSALLLDFSNINQNIVIPGNVYKVIDDHSFFSLEDAPPSSTKIIIEVTPPCDFSIDKKAKRSRVLGGFYVSNKIAKTQIDKYGKENFYKELSNININDIKQQIIRFDYRYFGSLNEEDLKNPSKYKLIFRVKDKLFADILQKLSSHTARLGLSVIK